MSQHTELVPRLRNGADFHESEGDIGLPYLLRQAADTIEALSVNPLTIDLDKASWEMLVQAASQSSWMPPEYCMNDWVSDCAEFLRNGNPLREALDKYGNHRPDCGWKRFNARSERECQCGWDAARKALGEQP